MNRFANSLALLGLITLCSGCVAAALVVGAGGGAGTYSYIKGELQATYNQPIQKVWPKTVAAVESLKLTVHSKKMDGLGGTIEAQRADGTAVKVQLSAAGDQSTIIGVRIGLFGNKKQSEQVHGAIRKLLNAP